MLDKKRCLLNKGHFFVWKKTTHKIIQKNVDNPKSENLYVARLSLVYNFFQKNYPQRYPQDYSEMN